MIMIILEAEKKDLQEILHLQYLAYQSEAQLLGQPDIPPLKQTLEEVAREFREGIFLKAVDAGGVIVGSVRAYANIDTLYIGKLMVHPDIQGQGIGTELLKEIERLCLCKRCELFTSSKSARNIKLYERVGYKAFAEKIMSADLKFIYLEKAL